jgi:hypothetical protein
LKLSTKFESEQKKRIEKVKTDYETVKTYEHAKADFDSFVTAIRKSCKHYQTHTHGYQRVGEKDYRSCAGQGQRPWQQKIQIIWNFIGEQKHDEDVKTTPW